MSISETSICNQSFAKIGAKRINNIDTDTSPEAIQARTHYEPTRDALIRSHSFRFARARKVLSQDAVDPVFEWDNQFILPNGFLRFRSIYEEDGATSKSRRHSLEGQRLLTNLSAVSLRYIKKVTDVTEFDPLFVQVLVLQLALKFIPALAKTDPKLSTDIKTELKPLMTKVEAVDMDETDVGGRSDWNLARHSGIGIASTEERFW